MKKFLLFVILFNVFKGAYSQTNTFTGSGTWDTNARWSLGVPPTAAQDAVINGAVTNIATTGNVCKTLTINGSFSNKKLTG